MSIDTVTGIEERTVAGFHFHFHHGWSGYKPVRRVRSDESQMSRGNRELVDDPGVSNDRIADQQRLSAPTTVGEPLPGDGEAVVVVVCGLPGTGKSTVAKALASRLNGERIRTDVVRKDLFSDPDYTVEEERAVYDELLARVRATIVRGRPAVADGTFKRAVYRRRAATLADDLDVTARFLKVACDPTVARERIRARTDDPSDADVTVYEQVRDGFEPVVLEHDVVDNSDRLADTVSRVDALVNEGVPHPQAGPGPS